jgi:hypothetical protein
LKTAREYRDVQNLPAVLAAKHGVTVSSNKAARMEDSVPVVRSEMNNGTKLIGLRSGDLSSRTYVLACLAPTSHSFTQLFRCFSPDIGSFNDLGTQSLVSFRHQQGYAARGGEASSRLSQALMKKKEQREAKPVYHAPCAPANPIVCSLWNVLIYLKL